MGCWLAVFLSKRVVKFLGRANTDSRLLFKWLMVTEHWDVVSEHLNKVWTNCWAVNVHFSSGSAPKTTKAIDLIVREVFILLAKRVVIMKGKT